MKSILIPSGPSKSHAWRRQRTGKYALALLLGVGIPTLAASEPQAELLARLRNTTSPVEQANLCAQLREVADSNAVPLLAPLLLQPQVAHAALHALENVPGPTATEALHHALVQTTGAVRVALVQSLGWRRDPASTHVLIPLLQQSDPNLLFAVALALARIGSTEAEQALQDAWEPTRPDQARLLAPALLLLAEQRRLEGKIQRAAEIYGQLLAAPLPAAVRRAAWMGQLRSTAEGLLSRAETLLTGQDPDAVAAVLGLWPEWPLALRTELAMRTLPKLDPAIQATVLAHLTDGAGPEVRPQIRERARGSDPAVRSAALRAMATVGDASDVPTLVQAAAEEPTPAKEAARWALSRMTAPGIAEALVDQLLDAPTESQVEALMALRARLETRAVPHLLQVLRTSPPPARVAVLRALEELAGPEWFDPLLRLVSELRDPEAQNQLVEFFQRWLERLAGQPLDTTALGEALLTDTSPSRTALFAIAAWVQDARVRAAIQQSLKSTEPGQRQAALQTLCQTRDPDLLPQILQECENAADPRLRTRLFESAARLLAELPIADPRNVDPPSLLLRWARLADTPAARRLCVSVLTRYPHPETLARVEQIRQVDAEARLEAELALVRIAAALADSWAPAEAQLEQLASGAAQPAVQAEARNHLRRLHSGWQVAGPYRVAGRQGPDLFNEVFPPENPAATHVAWRTVPAVAPDQPGHLDLSKLNPGDHCVLYARTQVFSPVEQSVRLKIGSDDGIKLWINGELVHAHNTVRGLVPGQDQASARLQAGWNQLFVKLTQHTAGCGVWIEIHRPDDAPVPGLIWNPRGPERSTHNPRKVHPPTAD